MIQHDISFHMMKKHLFLLPSLLHTYLCGVQTEIWTHRHTFSVPSPFSQYLSYFGMGPTFLVLIGTIFYVPLGTSYVSAVHFSLMNDPHLFQTL